MIAVRPARERGHFDFDWLNTYHTFSFGDYFDPAHMGYRSLRVINDDRVAPGGGFPTHPHRDMEILTWVLSGALEHKDSLGTGAVVRPGDLQRMTAGTGIRHSEFNPSRTEPVHLLQIWVMPEERGIAPSYDQKNFPEAKRAGKLRLIASHDGRDGSVSLRQDLSLYAGTFRAGESARVVLGAGRGAWVHVATGAVTVNGRTLREGDAVALEDEAAVEIAGTADGGEVLVFDLK